MSNTVRNGFSTLNRLLGKKNKNPLSKSATNLNKLSTTLDSTSQHNQIVPLAASTNAPFEQTFRITVCLPLDQLYVVRVGAKTQLSTLLEMVCANKLLDKEKFVFTHPVNLNQIFDLTLTIGEVGLNEIRLAHKTTSRHTDEHAHGVVNYRHTSSTPINHHDNNRYAARPQSMFITKSSPSPYSSTNSLNSTDSSGINLSLRSNGSHPPVAPTRKKRVAPRPPSQNSIPEDGEHKKLLLQKHTTDADGGGVFKRPLDRKDFHVSSPNLSNGGGHLNGGLKYKDFHVSNGNIYTINEPSGDNSLSGSDITNSSDGGIGKSTVLNRPISMHCDVRFSQNEPYDGTDLNGNRFSSFIGDGNHSRTSSEASETATRDSGFPEPTPRKKVIIAKKKAPAPPPRTTPINLSLPVATPRSITPKIEDNSRIIQTAAVVNDLPKKSAVPSPIKSKSTSNITKVMLNMENLQINIPDRPSLAQNENTASKPEHTEHVFQQKITHNEPTPTTDTNGQSAHINQIGSKLTDDEKTKAIEFNVSKKNSKNLIESRGVRFNGTADEIVQSTSDIDHEELNKEINDILEKATEEFAVQVKEEMSKEITNIINKAVEINESTNVNGNESVTTNGSYTPTDHTVNENDLDQAPQSPQWSYSLPAPAHFADNNISIASDLSSGENYNGKKLKSTVQFTSSPYQQNGGLTEKCTEIPIQPIIKKKQHVDFHEYSDNSLGTSNTTDTIASTSTDQDSLITSDIEDGYQGNDSKTKRSRELILQQQDVDMHREQFIESEFEFLSEHDDKSLKYEELPNTDSSANEQNIGMKKAPPPLQNGDSKKIELNRLVEASMPSKTDVIDELNNIINTNRLDSVIKKNEESDDIDAAKRCSLSNFQIRSYAKSVSETHSKSNGSVANNLPTDVVDNKKRHSLVDDRSPEKRESFTKLREFTPIKRTSLTLTNGHGNNVFKSPRHINRSDSFHSTHSMQQSYLQPHFNGGYTETLSLTPRSSSYISLIGTQRYENRTGKQLFGNELNENTRRKSSSELSIADSPSLQSLSVMKSILSNSRKNSLNNLSNETPIKVNGVDDLNQGFERRSSQVERQIIEDARDFAVEPKCVEEPPKNTNRPIDKVSDNANNENASSTPVSKMKAAFESKATNEEPKKWKYQGPPAISLSTWGERPKSQVVIKSDNDYKFGGIINKKKPLLQNRFSTTAIYDQSVEPAKPKPTLHKMFSTPQPSSAIEMVDKPREIAPKPAIKPMTKPEPIDQSSDIVDAQEPTIKEYERRITPLPASECQEQLHRPIVRGVEYKKNINLDEEFIKNDPIMRTKSGDDERVVMRSRSNYEVSRIVNERPFSLVQNGPASLMFDQTNSTHSTNSTMTLGRVQIPNKFTTHRQTINFAPQPYVNGSHTIQRNSSFTAISNASSKFVPMVKGFRTLDVSDSSAIGQQHQTTAKQCTNTITAAKRSTSPPLVKIGAYESQQNVRPLPTEKPVFAQFTLRKTGLKERILDANDIVERTQSPFNLNTKSTVFSSSGPKSLPPAPILPKQMPLATNRTTSVETKRSSFTPDPRNQLLDSIRNFSKNGLRKA